MPELPEVETTVRGLNQKVLNLKIKDLWSDLPKRNSFKKDEIKNLSFWNYFKKEVIGQKIVRAERIGKNILIHLSNKKAILVHMKMTGHLMYGTYRKGKKEDGEERHSWSWWPKEEPLRDPFNRFIHFLIVFSNGKHLAFSDTRKFGKVTLLDEINEKNKHLKDIGLDALSPLLTFKKFKEIIFKKPTGKIKTVLLDQSLIAGIGNIYSDEILYNASVHPESIISKIPEKKLKDIYKWIKPLLKKGIDFGGDSTSDYRNIDGLPGAFQKKHEVYRRKNEPCLKKGCGGTINRKVVGMRSAHYCPLHQVKY